MQFLKIPRFLKVEMGIDGLAYALQTFLGQQTTGLCFALERV